jgi:alpha-ketoglutarate-dependent taurine dioxygenase
MRQPLEIPAAWRGEELLRRDDWSRQLTEQDLDELRGATARSASVEVPVEQLQPEDFPLGQLATKLAAIQRDLEMGSGACLLRGLPIGQFADDSADGDESLRRLFWGLTTHLGTAVSQSAHGERIFSVRDEGFKVGQPQARGPNTNKRLSFHTDRCDVIAFLCVKPAKSGGENQLVSSVAVYNEMLSRRPDLVDVLMQPFYYRRHNVDTGNQQPWCRQPIFSFHEGHFACSYLRVLIDRAYAMPELPDLTAQQREAMDYLEELAGQPQMHVAFYLEPGDMLFLNNWVTLHRRSEFEDYDEPAQRRHLLRIWLSVPNSRPLHPDFAANFGATAAGAVRGGMRPGD